MPTFETIPARPMHCGQMARLLYSEDHAPAVRLGIHRVHQELRRCFDASSFRKAWLIDGKIAVLGGIMGSKVALQGYLWMAVSARARRYPVAFVKESLRQIEDASTTFREISAMIIDDEATDRMRDARFAKFIGFGLSPVSVQATLAGIPAMTFNYSIREAA